MIAYRYHYVVHKLHEKGLKPNVMLETGCVKSYEIKRSVIDLVRLAQTCYFGAENVRMIAIDTAIRIRCLTVKRFTLKNCLN